MVLGSISGKNVVDDKNFHNSYEISRNIFRITMVPKSAGMRRVISSIVMDFDIQSNFIHEIEMVSKNATTTLSFSGKKVNCHIPDTQFKF